MWDPIFPPASDTVGGTGLQVVPSPGGGEGGKVTRTGRARPPPQCPSPGRTRRRRAPLRPGRPRSRPQPPPSPEGSRRPAHLTAARNKFGSSGPVRPGAGGKKWRGLRSQRAGDVGGTARVSLRLPPSCTEGTTWRRAGAGPGESGRDLVGGAGPGVAGALGRWGGAWSAGALGSRGGAWLGGPGRWASRSPPARPHPFLASS